MDTFTLKLSLFFVLIIVTVGCRAVQEEERAEREALAESGEPYSRPFEKRELPEVTADSPYIDLLDRALRADPDIEIAYFEWAAALERVVTEGSPPDPELGFGFIFTEPLGGFFSNLIFLAGQGLPAPRKLNFAARRAFIEAKTAREKFEILRFSRKGLFRMAYAGFDGAAREVELAEREILLLDELQKPLEARIRSGAGGVKDILQIELERAKAADTRGAALAARRRAMAKVNILMSRPPFAELSALERLKPLRFSASDEQLLQLAARRNPQVREAEGEILAMSEGIARARAEEDPDLKFNFEREGTENKPSLLFTIPLRRDRVLAEIARAEAQYKQSLAKRRAVGNEIAGDTANAILQLREAARRSEYLEEQLLPKAQKAFELLTIQFGTGQATNIEIVEGKRALIEIERAMERTRVEREIALGDLLACCGADVSEEREMENAHHTKDELQQSRVVSHE